MAQIVCLESHFKKKSYTCIFAPSAAKQICVTVSEKNNV